MAELQFKTAICLGILCFVLSALYADNVFGLNSPDNFLPLIGFRVNEGKPYTNKKSVTVEIKSLKLSDSLIAEMKIGVDPTLEEVPWIKYSTEPRSIVLTSGDGEKFIYARLKDIAGNISPVEAVKVVLDTQPPVNVRLGINKDEKYTRDEQRRVVVYIQSDDKELSEMIFSNRKDFSDARWEKMADTKKWVLDMSGGDGEKIIFAKFKDLAGNESQIFEESIILDTQPPLNGSIVINNDAKYTQDRRITLTVRADEAIVVRIVSAGKSEVLNYEEIEGENHMKVEWLLDSIDGVKVVRAYFMDEAKNRTTNVIQDEIILDRTGPSPPVVIVNAQNRYTNLSDGKVNLRFTTSVNPETLKFMVSNYMDFHDAKPMAFRNQLTNWQLLAEEDGIKTIYVKYIDEAGNHSEVGMTKIMLDRGPPKVNNISVNEGGQWVTSPKITINMDVEEASHMQINNTEAISSMVSWEPYAIKKVDWTLLPGDGEKIIYLRFKDLADNYSPVLTTNVFLDTKPPTGELIIDGGARYSNHKNKSVTLTIHTVDGKGMQITNKPDFTDVKLMPLKDTVSNWVLDGEDGMKSVFLRLRDEAGNYSSVITSAIVLDRAPPTELSMIINEGQDWVRNTARRASVQLNAKGASHYMLSEDPQFTNQKWDVYKNVTTWEFSEQEGEKTVYVRFMDASGNISEIISAAIKLDYSPPLCQEFTIDEDSDFTNNSQKKVTLIIKAPEALKMAISNNPINDPTDVSTQWEDYMETKEWVLDGEDGLKTVHIIFRDEAGNFSGRYNDRIILDRIAPTDCNVRINNDAKYVLPGSRKIPIELAGEGADKIIISENQEFTNARWELYIPRKIYEVSEGDGIKNIYIKFRDKALNETDVFTSLVILDTKPPEIVSLTINSGENYTNNASKTINLTIECKDAVEMRLSQKGQAPGDWETFNREKTMTLAGEDGEKEIGVFLRDEAGNIAKPIISKIVLDRRPPKPESFVIDDGRGWTNDPDKKVALNFKADGAYEMMISTKPSFEDASWENYTPTVKNYELQGEDGEKIIFVKFRDQAGNVSPPISSKVNLKRSF